MLYLSLVSQHYRPEEEGVCPFHAIVRDVLSIVENIYILRAGNVRCDVRVPIHVESCRTLNNISLSSDIQKEFA